MRALFSRCDALVVRGLMQVLIFEAVCKAAILTGRPGNLVIEWLASTVCTAFLARPVHTNMPCPLVHWSCRLARLTQPKEACITPSATRLSSC